MPSKSFTTSLRSANSPVSIKKYDKRELPAVSILPPLDHALYDSPVHADALVRARAHA